MDATMHTLLTPLIQLLGPAWLPVWTLAKIIAIVAPLMIALAYLTYAERKVIGYMQVRIGPNRVGPIGLLQPIADGLKLLMKEIIIPSGANKGLFILGPVLVLAPALAAWAVFPFTEHLVLADFVVQLSKEGLSAVARGEPFDLARHVPAHEVKAITYHGLKCDPTGSGWLAEVIVDI